MEGRQKLYNNRRLKYKKLSDKLEKRIHSIGNWRLVSAVSGIIVAIFAYRTDLYYLLWSSLIIFPSLFIYLVIQYHKVENLHNYVETILKINQSSIKRLKGEWVDFKDTGAEFKDDNHEYSQDLDIFGRGSLFQWISTTHTDFGREKLQKLLTKPCYEKELLIWKQDAMKELAQKRWWRQKYQAEAMQTLEEKSGNQKFLKWISTFHGSYSRKDLIYIIRILPILTIIAILLGFGLHLISVIIPVIAIFIHIGLFFMGLKTRNRNLKGISIYQKNIMVYIKMLKHFEKTNFKSTYIKDLKDEVKSHEGLSAYEQLITLEKLVHRISNRDNIYFFPINIILLWDYQCMISLERWKNQSGHLIENWLKVLGEMEALSSLAIINFDYPNWTIPEFTTETSVFSAKDLGHPLLTNKQVYNDLRIEKPENILLITGSNMSGKSTLLRTTGINLVLAYAGAPVCAQQFQCSFMRLFSCMRVSDNLEKNISSFYAELLRIKEILIATKEDRQVFFLLDEIFKGTNSQDRHIGAKMLIIKLYKENAIGLVSTHDLELGTLEKESNGKILNYHFQEYYKEDQIFFDYTLRRGVSTTRNALYLMKMVGIES